MWVRSLTLDDFRSYTHVECTFQPGINVLLGRNGQGKTNALEAVGYIATQRSHRAGNDGMLVRRSCERGLISCEIDDDGRSITVDIAIVPGRANRARVNKVPVPRAGAALGHLRSVVFSPEDLALVKGDPAARRSFLDDLLVQLHPRIHAVIDDFEKALRQRNALLKSLRERRASRDTAETSLAIWDEHVALAGGSLVSARMALVHQLRDPFSRAYAEIAGTPGEAGDLADVEYRAGWLDGALPQGDPPDATDLAHQLHVALVNSRVQDLARGVTSIGPQRDDMDIRLDGVLARGYASHGESWSLALALRLAGFRLLRDVGPTPVLLLDDVFAELDTRRRTSLAAAITDADQVIVTAAVEEDVPMQGPLHILDVASGTIRVRTTQ